MTEERKPIERFMPRDGHRTGFLWSANGGLWTHHEGPAYGGKGWCRAVEVERLEAAHDALVKERDALMVALRATREYNEHAWNCRIPHCRECDRLKVQMVDLRVAALDGPDTVAIPPEGGTTR